MCLGFSPSTHVKAATTQVLRPKRNRVGISRAEGFGAALALFHFWTPTVRTVTAASCYDYHIWETDTTHLYKETMQNKLLPLLFLLEKKEPSL